MSTSLLAGFLPGTAHQREAMSLRRLWPGSLRPVVMWYHPGASENSRSTVALRVLLNAASEPAVVAMVVAVALTINPSIQEAGGISESSRPAQAL